MVLLLLACARSPAPPAAPPAPGPTLRERFGEWVFLTPRDAPPTVALVGGGRVPTDAATCGSCHPDFYAEWRATTHASAVRDPQYLAELAKPDNPRWLCLNCHAPTAPQRAGRFTLESRLVTADDLTRVVTEPNPDFDPARVAEGVTCATCHVRRDADGEGIIVGPGLATTAPHRVQVDPDGLRGVCVQCHSPGRAVISPTFFCWFETADELAKGPDADRTCVECHMPGARRAMAGGAPEVDTRQHHWVGGGVPKSVEAYDTLLDRGWAPGLAVTVGLDLPAPGAPLTPTVSLANHAGHSLPTADPERHLRVEARVVDAAGATLSSSVIRVGQTWDWGDAASGRPARRLADDRLSPGETRAWSPALPARPTWAGLSLVVEVGHVRLTPDNAAGMRTAPLDAELLALWPEAAAVLPAIDRRYPLATWIFRESVDLSTGARTVATLPELVEASRRLADAPLDEKRARLAIP